MHHNAHKNGGAGFGSPVCFYEVLKVFRIQVSISPLSTIFTLVHYIYLLSFGVQEYEEIMS